MLAHESFNTMISSQLWDHDIHLTDDFLGQAVIQLRDLEPEGYEPKAQVLSHDARWFELHRAKVGSTSVGNIKIALRLIMNAENVTPDQFKQMALKAGQVRCCC